MVRMMQEPMMQRRMRSSNVRLQARKQPSDGMPSLEAVQDPFRLSLLSYVILLEQPELFKD